MSQTSTGDVGEPHGARPSGASAASRPARGKADKRGFFARIALFLRQVVDELRKVVTPTREELVKLTGIVLAFVILMIWLMVPWLERSILSGERSMNAGGLILWPAKALLLAGFILLFFQGLSEIIKKIAVMRGLIPDPHAEATHHAAGEVMIDQTLLAETGFASADHPATDEMIDHPLDHNRNYTDDDAARETGSGGRPATDTRPNGGPRE